jgi:hypothetical protein
MNSEHRDLIQVACASALLMLLVVLMMFGLKAAFGADNGQIPPNVPDNIRSWFKSVRSPNGVPCCDIADGHRTTWRAVAETEEDSGYEVPIGDQWVPVPKRAIVYNAGNPVGEAIVWYTQQGTAAPYIRCFVPDGGV